MSLNDVEIEAKLYLSKLDQFCESVITQQKHLDDNIEEYLNNPLLPSKYKLLILDLKEKLLTTSRSITDHQIPHIESNLQNKLQILGEYLYED